MCKAVRRYKSGSPRMKELLASFVELWRVSIISILILIRPQGELESSRKSVWFKVEKL